MSRSIAKPVGARDPMIGRRVRVTHGKLAGQEGTAINVWRNRISTADRVLVRLVGAVNTWNIRSVPATDIEVLP